MADAGAMMKRLDAEVRTALRHLKAAKVSAGAGEHLIEQLKDRAAVGELTSYEIAALTESATTVSKVLAGFALR